MSQEFSRTKMLFGEENMQKLKNARVAVFGLGGVGSYVAEGLCRGGVYHLTLVDHDTVDLSNLNRQLIATYQTLGMPKAEAAKERLLCINPQAEIEAVRMFVDKDSILGLPFSKFDYVVDAVDTVTAKILLIQQAKAQNVPVISCMGTGNKLDSRKFCFADISQTSVCPLARVMRKELKDRGITGVKVLYSTEPPQKCEVVLKGNKQVPASVSFVPSVAGLMIAGEVILDLLK